MPGHMGVNLGKLRRSSTLRVMFLTALGMALGLAVTILIAARFGATALTDALFIALLIPRMLGNVARDATKFSLITVLLHAEKRDGLDAMRELTTRVLNLFLLLGLALVVIGFAAAPPIIALIGPGLDDAGRATAVTLFRWCLPMLMFALGSAVLEVLLNSQRQFAAAALRNAAAPAVVIALMVASWKSSHTAWWVAVGYSAGAAVFFLWLAARARATLAWRYRVRDMPDGNTWRVLRRDVGLPLTGFTVRQSSRIVERSFASLTGAGGVAHYSFAYQLLAAIQNLVGTSVALTGQPRLTEHDLAGDRVMFFRLLRRRVGITLLFSAPMAVVLMALHKPIVAALFGWGSFDAEAVEATARVLLWLGPAIIFYCLIPVLTSALYAQQRVGAVLANMCLMAAINIVGAWFGYRCMGLTGIALAATITSAVSVANLTFLLVLKRSPAPTSGGGGAG